MSSLDTSYLESLPDEAIQIILLDLPIKSLLSIGETSRRLYKLTHDNYLWYKMLLRDFYANYMNATYYTGINALESDSDKKSRNEETDRLYTKIRKLKDEKRKSRKSRNTRNVETITAELNTLYDSVKVLNTETRHINMYYSDESYYDEYMSIYYYTQNNQQVFYLDNVYKFIIVTNFLYRRDIILEYLQSSETINLVINYGAYRHFDTLLIKAIERNELTKVKILLNAGANPNTNYETGYEAFETVLILAITLQNYNIIKLLLQYGADPNERNFDAEGPNDTPLIIAIWFQQLETIKLLLDAGADIHAREMTDFIHRTYGKTPIEIAQGESIYNQQIIDYLLHYINNKDMTN